MSLFRWWAEGGPFELPSREENLKRCEEQRGYTWTQMHSYKDMMTYPPLPTLMDPEPLLSKKEIYDCMPYFEQMDRCIEMCSRNEDSAAPYGRFEFCAQEYKRFKKCTYNRNYKMNKEIKKWEVDHLKHLDDKGRQEYVADLDDRMMYLEYVKQNVREFGKYEVAQRDLGLLEERKKHIDKKWKTIAA